MKQVMISLVVFSVVLHWFIAENQRLQTMNAITEKQIALLRDQVADMESRGTYDEGFSDAMITSTPDYASGYHAALRQKQDQTIFAAK